MTLTAVRVLVVEDEPLLLMELSNFLGEMGCNIVAREPTLKGAVEQANKAAIDVAVLDMNLGGERADGVAEALAARGIPFIFATGYSDRPISTGYGCYPRLQKPYRPDALRAALLEALSLRGSQP